MLHLGAIGVSRGSQSSDVLKSVELITTRKSKAGLGHMLRAQYQHVGDRCCQDSILCAVRCLHERTRAQTAAPSIFALLYEMY